MAISEKKMQIVIDNYFKSECNINTTIKNAFEKGFHIGVKKALSAQPEPHWIPCSERLPEDGERVLATHLGGLNPDRQVIEHIYVNGEFTMGWNMDMNKDSPTFGQRYMGKVVAWMLLPEPWEEEE